MDKVYTIIFYDSAKNAKVSVNVNKEIFDEYRRGIWRIRKNNVKHSKNTILFCALKTEGEDTYENFHEVVNKETNPENVVVDKFNKENLRHAILCLKSKERDIVKALFFDGLSASEYARSIGKTPQYIHKCKTDIFKKSKKTLEEMV